MSNSQDAPSLRQREPLRILTDVPLFVRCPSDSSSPSNSNITPGTSPSTVISQPFHALCMHDFRSSDPVHLPFCKHEVLTIVKQEHSGWWAAMRPQGDRVGWIPSSFVLPLRGDKIMKYPSLALALRPCDGFRDAPLSAVHDQWVPVSEDCDALSFRLVTPTDLPDYTTRNRNCESFFSPLDNKLSSDYIPLTPDGLPYKIQRRCHSSLYLSALGASRPASPSLASGTALHRHHSRSCQMDDVDEASFPCLTSLNGSAETTPDRIASLASKADLKSVATSEVGTCYNLTHGQELQTDFRPAEVIHDIKLLGTSWSPERLAEQFCVLMHTLYAAICRNECLNWVARRGGADMSGLQHFFGMHDRIASWVQQSILACNNITRQTETLDNWIKVAERCHALHNFDSLCAIISALSAPSLTSLGSAWVRCAHKRTFTDLRDAVDADGPHCLVNIMDAVEGPSVPFIHGYLEHIKQLRVADPNKPLHQPGHVDDTDASTCRGWQAAAVSALLSHRSSSYDFKIANCMRNFMDDETVGYWQGTGPPEQSR